MSLALNSADGVADVRQSLRLPPPRPAASAVRQGAGFADTLRFFSIATEHERHVHRPCVVLMASFLYVVCQVMAVGSFRWGMRPR
ncbi:MAG: hypothetical protein QOG10_4571 [Kribbellaceae bacterium]|nr:hypothetical protein [Kribbellaceae bacterium]